MYAFLNVPKLGVDWHPFSIASDPKNPTLDFYIQVYDGKSWTSGLWWIIKELSEGEELIVHVMGPYGSSVGDLREFTDAIMIGK